MLTADYFTTIITENFADYCKAMELAVNDTSDDNITHCLLSVKEYIGYNYNNKEDDLKDTAPLIYGGNYEFSHTSGKYTIYDNADFIPMGYTYDYCISKDDFLALDKDIRKPLILKAMVVEDTAAVSDYLEKIPDSEIYALSDEEFAAECAARAKTSARKFVTDNDSYTAEITLEKPELVFFSITYYDDFTAYVDGEETEILKANLGFQAIPVPAGTHTVKAVYHSRKRSVGTACTALGTAGLAVYTAASYFLEKRRKNAQKAS